MRFIVSVNQTFLFTDTINLYPTQLNSSFIFYQINILNYETFNLTAYSTDPSVWEGFSRDYRYNYEIKGSSKYIYKIDFSFTGTCNDYADIWLNLGGNSFAYQEPHTYYNDSCNNYTSLNGENWFVNYVNFNVEKAVTFYNKNLNITIRQNNNCHPYSDIHVIGRVTVYYR